MNARLLTAPAAPVTATAPAPNRLLGLAAVGLAIAFNIPYALLAATFEYPAVLRLAAADVLARFTAGGPRLVLTWYGFALSALALVPLAIALSITRDRLHRAPALAIGAAIAGALAGSLQAIGLLRWVFAVPILARAQALADANPATALAARLDFALLNAWGGVAIGEHLGQLLTALFVAQLALLQRREGQATTAATGLASAALIAIGSGEALAIALGGSGDGFGLATIAGFLGFTLWLVLTGHALNRP